MLWEGLEVASACTYRSTLRFGRVWKWRLHLEVGQTLSGERGVHMGGAIRYGRVCLGVGGQPVTPGGPGVGGRLLVLLLLLKPLPQPPLPVLLLLLTTYYLLPTTYYLLLTTYYLLFTIYCSLLVAYSLHAFTTYYRIYYYLPLTCYLPIANCYLPLATCYVLLATYYFLPTSYFLLISTTFSRHYTCHYDLLLNNTTYHCLPLHIACLCWYCYCYY